jgi:3-oxoacyl-[acyl-carrier-protein] synthase-3
MNAYITALGRFLPGLPIDNGSMEQYIGTIGGKPSGARKRVLKQNGIETRYYAIDRQQKTLFSNAEMAAHAARQAVERAGVKLSDVDFLVTATSQGDLPLPGFASMVHGELKIPPCEIATVHGVCASGMMAMKSAMLQVASAGRRTAVACASEFASRLFKSSRFEDQLAVREKGLTYDAEFLRWMLSDGAGAAVLSDHPARTGLSLRIEWIELLSFANKFEPCMYVGPPKDSEPTPSWLDYANYREAADAGAINLRQDIRMLDEVVRHAVYGLVRTAKEKNLEPSAINWMAVHYSSRIFRDQSHAIATKAGFEIPLDRWFSNLTSTGNVGSASTFLLLEEMLYSGKLRPGERILCLVPESGRFLFGYMLLTVVEGEAQTKESAAATPTPSKELFSSPPEIKTTSDPLSQQLVRELGLIWFEFEEQLQNVQIVRKIYDGNFTVEDYRDLLYNLRQQVIDGSRWIARAASSITPDHFQIRASFILHTKDEHRDFEMIERNYALVGGSLEEIRSGRKNIGSEALSAYILHRASLENPFDLVGAMFIVEGLGQRIARKWGEKIQQTLGLPDDAVSFFLYHSASDIVHFQRLDLVVASGILTPKVVADILRCAKVTARLYALQLEEIGHF